MFLDPHEQDMNPYLNTIRCTIPDREVQDKQNLVGCLQSLVFIADSFLGIVLP